jgi:hypothetical protein
MNNKLGFDEFAKHTSPYRVLMSSKLRQLSSETREPANKSCLPNKFEDINIFISSGEAAVYLASDDSLISRLEKSNVSLTSKLDKEGFYNTDLKLDVSGSKYGPSGVKYAEYVKDEVMAEFYPELAAQQKLLPSFQSIPMTSEALMHRSARNARHQYQVQF